MLGYRGTCYQVLTDSKVNFPGSRADALSLSGTNWCPRRLTFLVNRTRSPIESMIFSRSNTLKFRAWSGGKLLLDAVLSDDDGSLVPAKDFPLFTAFKALFLDSSANSSLGNPVKLDDLRWFISDRITLLGVSQVQPLKPCDGMFRV